MDGVHAHELIDRAPVLARLAAGEPVEWANPARKPMDEVRCGQELGAADIDDARARLERFAPLVAELFPQTRERGGIIESELVEIPAMRAVLNERHGAGLSGRLLLKKDGHLAVAGSVKARGGIYEVLKYAEDLALEEGLLSDRAAVFACGAQAPKGVDALAGAALAGRIGCPVLLVNGNEEIEGVNTYTVDNYFAAHAKNCKDVYILGGEFVMPPELVDKISALLG